MTAPPDPSPAAVTLWKGLITTARRLLDTVEDALKAQGLPPLAWYDALWEIEKAGPDGLRPFALEARLLLPQYGTSRLLDRIEKAGLIARRPCPDDGRGHVVAITDAGRALRRQMWPVYGAALQGLLGHLPPAEAEALAAALARLRGDAGGVASG